MSRKHFRKLAEAIRTADVDPDARRNLAESVASVCAECNPRFRRSTFLEACGVEA